MVHVSVLVPKGDVAFSCIDGAFTFFTRINEILVSRRREALFVVELVGDSPEVSVLGGRFSIKPDRLIAEVSATDLVIVPAVNGDKQRVVSENAPLLPWIVDQHKKGAEVASLCVGAFILAATGLLDGKMCTTHWSAVEEFKQEFAGVNVVSSEIVTDQKGVYSSGGALSFWNLLLYLAEKYTDRSVAVLASKFFEIDFGRHDQSAFVVFESQKRHADEAIKRAQTFIENNLNRKILLDDIAREIAVAPRNLQRRFKAATGDTVSDYVHRVKVEFAKRLLESGSKTALEVMDLVGYTDPRAFRFVFKQFAGVTPAAYKETYSRIREAG